MRQRELNLPRAGSRTEEAALEVQRHGVIGEEPAPLGVEQERVADVLEAHLLAVAKRLDRGVVARSLASPRPQQEGERLDVRMQLRLRHPATLARCSAHSVGDAGRSLLGLGFGLRAGLDAIMQDAPDRGLDCLPDAVKDGDVLDHERRP